MKHSRMIRWTTALTLAGAAWGVQASGFSASSTDPASKLNFAPDQVITFAKKVERTLAEQGTHVALLARMGRPQSEMPEGMHFTHVAFAVYSEITTADGRKLPGYAIHNLYQLSDRPDVSELVVDYPVDFFSAVAELEAGLIIPSPQLQERLLKVIGTPAYTALHDPHYSLIANPYTLGRQNCTEFVLDVIQSAIYQTDNLGVIKANTRSHFKAQEVNVNPFKLLLGSMFSAEVSMSDQPGSPVTATFETIGDYLRGFDPATRVIKVAASAN
ncbi:MAG: hypothetical protein RJA36_1544 [Pseudomonadota bacterium]|jgi:hypothetical protein